MDFTSHQWSHQISLSVFNDMDLNVSMYHKALIEIEEEGAEAAAATALAYTTGI